MMDLLVRKSPNSHNFCLNVVGTLCKHSRCLKTLIPAGKGLVVLLATQVVQVGENFQNMTLFTVSSKIVYVLVILQCV